MSKAKIAAAAMGRVLWLFVMSILFVVAFPCYVVFVAADWFISYYSAFIEETKRLFHYWDEQLTALKKKV